MGHSSERAIHLNGSSLVELNSNFNIEDDVWALRNLFKMKFQVALIYFKKKKLVDSTILSWMGHSSEWTIQVNGSSSVELNSNSNIEDDVWALWNLFKMKFQVRFDIFKKKKASW